MAGLLWLGAIAHDRYFDPRYQGKRLSILLEELEPDFQIRWRHRWDSTLLVLQIDAAATAVQGLGKRTIPQLKRMLRAHDSKLKLRIMEVLRQTGWTRRDWAKRSFIPAEVKRARALAGLEALGPQAQPLLPDLMRLLKQNNEHYRVLRIVGSIGPAAADAIPLVAPLLSRTNGIAWQASETLAGIGISAIPPIISVLQDSNAVTCNRVAAAWAINHMGLSARSAESALLGRVRDLTEHPAVVMSCIQALGSIGIESPALLDEIIQISDRRIGLHLGTDLMNGDFSELSSPANTNQFVLEPLSMQLPGWLVYDGIVGVTRNPEAGEHRCYVELGPRVPPGAICQSFITRIGQTYEISFSAASGRNPSGRIAIGDLNLVFRPQTQPYSKQFTELKYRFTTHSLLSTLRFEGLGVEALGPTIRTVVVQPIVR